MPTIVSAADLNNYYYAHANEPGSYVLRDKYNHTTLNGDYAEDDATINQIKFRTPQGFNGETVTITTRDGRSFVLTDLESAFVIPDPKTKSVTITLKKTTYSETYVEISYYTVFDQSNGGVNLSYRFTGDAPTSYGSLGAGQATAAPTPTPTATATAATPTPTPTASVAPTPTPINTVNLYAYVSGLNIVWSTPPTNTDHIEVWKDGVKLATLPKTTREYPLEGDGDYYIRAISTQGNLIGETELIINSDVGTPNPTPTPSDPGGGTTDPDPDPVEPCTTESCQNLIDMLECPEFDTYLGAWADMIKTTYPPPPDWDNVASIMRDTIVPAMGQEIVNRSPEIARIIADELQSREKAVSPPPVIADFTPPVPRFTDTPKVTGNLTDNVPNFTPDYSEDKAFIIPDPTELDFTDNSDDGYEYQPLNTAAPTYVPLVDPSTVDLGYKELESQVINPPDYVVKTPTDQPAPNYNAGGDSSAATPPPYKGSEHTGDYRVYKAIPDEFKEYQGE